MIRMLRVNPMPALRDGKVGSGKEGGQIAEHQTVDFLFVENIYAQAVLMGIAERKLALRGLRHKAVNLPAVVLRSFAGDALSQRGKRFADGKGAIETQRQTSRERRTEFPAVWLWVSAQHLQLDSGEARARVRFGIERFEVVSAANDRVIHAPLFRAGHHYRQFDLPDRA